MPGKYLIDLTDDRFKIAANESVIEFIRVANPFAHTDVGIRLLDLGKLLPGSTAYCPSYGSCAYVVLHNDASRIFAIAYGQRGLAFRLKLAWSDAAFSDGARSAPTIGPDWFSFDAYGAIGDTETFERLRRWSELAFFDAASDSAR